jgi:hypothetical protein
MELLKIAVSPAIQISGVEISESWFWVDLSLGWIGKDYKYI